MEKLGFDIVVGNPPYISTKNTSIEQKKAFEQIFGFSDDLYYHFIIKGFDLLKSNGINTMITPDTFFTTITKKELRKTLITNKLCKLVHLGYDVFDCAMVSTSIFISQKNEVLDNKTVFLDVKGKKILSEGESYEINQNLYNASINGSFFTPNEMNLKIHNKLALKHKELINAYWSKISTSRDIEKNKLFLDEYRTNLKEGDYTLIGLVTEGGQGMATANNGKYVGVKIGTKEAIRTKDTRVQKLNEVNKKLKTNYVMPNNELEVIALFDDIRLKYGRDVFGQGYLYKIVDLEDIADVNMLTSDEKTNGINSQNPTFVPYDKGDKDGNRWYLPTPYYIDWSVENVKFLRNDKKARYQNPQFYFKEGFCYSGIKTFYLKCRKKSQSVYDVASMSMFSINNIPEYYLITLINSKTIALITDGFIANTPSFQINDCRSLIIPVPTSAQLLTCKALFDDAVSLQQNFFAKKITLIDKNSALLVIQNKVDEFVEKLFDL